MMQPDRHLYGSNHHLGLSEDAGQGAATNGGEALEKRSACDINGQLSPLTTPLFFPHHVQLSAGLYTKQSWPMIPSK